MPLKMIKEPIHDNDSYIGLFGNKAFEAGFEALKGIYKDQIKESNDLMNKKTDINFTMIRFEDVPEMITPADFDQLSIMISAPEPIKANQS